MSRLPDVYRLMLVRLTRKTGKLLISGTKPVEVYNFVMNRSCSNKLSFFLVHGLLARVSASKNPSLEPCSFTLVRTATSSAAYYSHSLASSSSAVSTRKASTTPGIDVAPQHTGAYPSCFPRSLWSSVRCRA